MKNKLKINNKGSLLPLTPSRSFNDRYNIITNTATNMNSAPLFYIEPRINTLWSSTSPNMPNAYAVLKFGNLNSMRDIYGNLYNKPGNQFPNKTPNLNLTVDSKGNYKLVNENGKSFKIHYNSNGGYINYNKNKIFL